jgi:hypothetical protein
MAKLFSVYELSATNLSDETKDHLRRGSNLQMKKKNLSSAVLLQEEFEQRGADARGTFTYETEEAEAL